MMPVRQLARLNFGTPPRESTREPSSAFSLSLSPTLPLLPVVPRTRDKEKVRLPREQKKKKKRRVDEIAADCEYRSEAQN